MKKHEYNYVVNAKNEEKEQKEKSRKWWPDVI